MNNEYLAKRNNNKIMIVNVFTYSISFKFLFSFNNVVFSFDIKKKKKKKKKIFFFFFFFIKKKIFFFFFF